ncbi:hypothetical protein SAY87_017093 [Trapa incisa]|uniref:MYB transcription factor n=1 Tax=Trapa incisa TaxID=236973 RepID=A0AAN7L754_9MYRT|nr:hypothetical protein SAY87_017093 [Trapa incisa]
MKEFSRKVPKYVHPCGLWALSLKCLNKLPCQIGIYATNLFHVCMLQKRQEVLPNFRSHVGSRLRRLVLQGKLEKVHNTYRINRDAPLRKRPAAPKQMDIQLRLIQSPMLSSHETLQEAAMAAAYKIAEAENKSFLASAAVKEAERVSKMADDSDAMLQLMKEIYGQCSRGERIIPA